MATLIGAGSVVVQTNGHEYGGPVEVSVSGMRNTDSVLVSTAPGNKGLPPLGAGPLFVPFVSERDQRSFKVLVYDIQANPHDVGISVDWAVVRP